MDKSGSDKPDRKKAVAIQYNDAKELPRVVASGIGEVAQKIVELAKAHKIPVDQNSKLVELLQEVNVGNVIPPGAYRLVAELVTFLYHCDLEWQRNHSALGSALNLEEIPKLGVE